MTAPAPEAGRVTRLAAVRALGCAACAGGAGRTAQDIVLADSAGVQIVTVRSLDILGRSSIDAGLEIEESGSDYVLIRSTDADGVESIRLHSLSRG